MAPPTSPSRSTSASLVRVKFSPREGINPNGAWLHTESWVVGTGLLDTTPTSDTGRTVGSSKGAVSRWHRQRLKPPQDRPEQTPLAEGHLTRGHTEC